MLFEIWEEGNPGPKDFGENFPARKLGEAEGDTFLEACQNLYDSDEEIKNGGYPLKIHNGEPYRWGLTWFDNEVDARKRNG